MLCSGLRKSYIRISESSYGRLKQVGRAIEVCSPLDDWWVSSVPVLMFQLGDGAERGMLCYAILYSGLGKW